MDANTKQALVNAINLIKAGNNQEAVPILAALLKSEPNLVQGWYLLGLAVESHERKLKAFRQALKLDPTHAKAFEQLAILQAQGPAPIEEPALPEEPQEPEPEPEPEPPQIQQTEPSQADEQAEESAAFRSPTDLFGDEASEPEAPDQDDEESIRRSLDATPPGLQPDFDLPSWMDKESFDPSEYDYGEDQEIYLNTEEDIPDWAQMNPFEAPSTGALGPGDSEALEEEPETEPEPYQPVWAQEADDDGDYEEEEPELPDWAVSVRQHPAEEADEYESSESDLDRMTAFFDQQDQAEEDELEEDSPDAPPEEPDWLREMVDEEGGSKRRRKKAATPIEKRMRRRRIVLILLTVIFVGLGAAGYYFREELRPYWETVEPYANRVIDPVKTQFAPVSALITQDLPLTYLLTPGALQLSTPTNTIPAQPTAAPTRTPQPTAPPATATVRSVLGPNETPTVTPTPVPLPEEVLSQMETIENQIVGLRGLTRPGEIVRVMVTKQELREQMEALLVDAELLERLEDDRIELQAMGFINNNYNLVDAELSQQANSLGGFYLPEANKVYVVGGYFDGFSAVEQYVYTQEFTHALQDNRFDLTGLGYYPECTAAGQACQAVQALVQGDAVLTSQFWRDEYPPQVGLQDILNYNPPSTLFQSSPLPYFAMDTSFAATAGLEFVQYLYDNGGWSAVNRAYNVLPTTTEQILHPEKYQQGEGPGAINAPEYNDLLPQEWELIKEDALGEWNAYLLLAYNDYSGAKRPASEAALAAEGWSADKYQVYYNPEERQVFLSVYWVWDTPDEAAQFYQSLQPSLSSRFGNAEVETQGSSSCWVYQQQKSCIQRDGNKIYWLLSDDDALLDQIRERFTLFP